MDRQLSIVLLFSSALATAGWNVAAQDIPRDVAGTPDTLRTVGRIAPLEEPGTPLLLEGTVLAEDGETPLPGVIVYAYHTDARGYLRKQGMAPDSMETHPRLEGWLKTDSTGHFEFATIKPAGYPGWSIFGHVMLYARGGGYPRRWFMLEFKEDSLASTGRIKLRTPDYLVIAPLTRDARGIERCAFLLRMQTKSNVPKGE